MKIYLVIFSLIFSIIGCEIFSTREPEKPGESKYNFVPPTEPSLVVQNFEYSIKEKNLENFIKCFSPDGSPKTAYKFYPAQTALSSFSSIFDNWSIESERRVFNSVISLLTEETSPVLYWQNRKPISEYPDSAIFESEYFLQFNFTSTDNSIPVVYQGTIRLTMLPSENGLWSISSWYDFDLQKDSINTTWSFLKAKMYN